MPAWRRWLSRSTLGIVALVLAGLGLAITWLDSPAGHRFVTGRIAALEPASGLRISVGAVEGSLLRSMRLHDVRFSDPQGPFAVIRRADVTWSPLGWASNRLELDRLHVESARIERLPRLRPGRADGRLLPDFDLRLLDLRVDQLELGRQVAGREHLVRIVGNADIRDGRAVVALYAASLTSADSIRIALDSRPDSDRFALSAEAAIPAGGIVASLAGLRQPMALAVRGSGDWTDWQGRMVALEAGQTVANLGLAAQNGRFRVAGPLAFPGPVRQLAQRLGVPALGITAAFTLADRQWQGRAGIGARGLTISTTGGVDLRRSRFDDLRLQARLARLEALAPGAQGRNLVLDARLIGPLTAPGFEWLLAAPEIRQGKLALVGLRAGGSGRVTAGGTAIPVNLTARALQLGAPPIDQRLRDLRTSGRLLLAGGRLSGPPISLRANGFSGALSVDVSLNGRDRTQLALDGRFPELEVPGLGRADVAGVLRLANAAPGAPLAFTGVAQARMARLDNGFLRGLGGGLPQLDTRLRRGADGRIMLEGVRLRAPALALDADGWRNRDGSFHFTGGGRHRAYGPLRLTLDGRIERPRVDLLLLRPADALGLANVRAILEPDAAGYAVRAQGASALGPFTANGAVLLPRGAQAVIEVARLATGEVTARGRLFPVTGGLEGTLDMAGPVTGTARLAMAGGVQTVGLDLAADNAQFAGPPALTIGRGTLKGLVTLAPGATGIDATVQAIGTRYGGVRIGRLAGNVRLAGGSGTATISASGQRGRLFDLQSRLAIAPDRIGIELAGSVDQQRVALTAPAKLLRLADGGWQLAPATLGYRGGTLRAAGRNGPAGLEVDLAMERLPLSLLDLAQGDLGLGGTAHGTLRYRSAPGAAPTGQAALTLRGLTRSGLSLSSAPVDVGINAMLDGSRAAMRAVLAKNGRTVGRGQALLAPLGAGTLVERLNNAPLRAQLRYAGAVDTLWGLSRIEIVTLAGNAAITADVRGTLADPVISGSVSSDDGQVQSAVTGLALRGVRMRGSFTDDRLDLTELHGSTAGGGSVAGTARFTFSGARGLGMAIDLEARRALLLDRDDIGATVSGPLRIQSDGAGGLISGDLELVSSRFALGRAGAVAEIPQLRLIEINRNGEEMETDRPASPWRLAINARAPRGLMVSGLGMESEWSADLRIAGTVTSPALTGSAELVRGDYDFAGRRFALRDGRLRFDGSVPVNPTLDIRAVADVSSLDATISVTGTSLRPIIAFSSIPALPQDELLARLLFGTSITQLSAAEAVQLASAVASLQSGGGLDPINALRRLTGLSRLRILPADSTQGRQTAVAAGKYIGRRIYVELITDGQGYSATRIEYQITRWLSLLSSISTIGRQSLNVRASRDY